MGSSLGSRLWVGPKPSSARRRCDARAYARWRPDRARVALAMSTLFLALTFACNGNGGRSTPDDEENLAKLRDSMVTRQLQGRDVVSKPVLEAMRKVPRHKFVPPSLIRYAYSDQPLSIGEGQTISQPYIVGIMTQVLRPKPEDKILEIGTGSGYQAAVLAEIVKEVFTIEIVESLGKSARKLLEDLDYKNIHVRIGDGYKGWPSEAPFDGVIVTAAPDHVPEPLKQQLKVGGRLVIPVGRGEQALIVITRTEEGFVEETVLGVRFVPMTGEAQEK
jgi:protein-L-isoaspartate(D-aspartate) O-methyltransferase